MSVRRAGLPIAVKMRHNAHYVEEIISRSGAAIGRMISIEEIQPYADQPRKDRGDLRGLTESVREKGVLEPLLVRRYPESGKYLIISGERRYFAACAAGLTEVPCIEKDADDAETLELALIENMQRKDLTPFEEADGVQALGDRFGLTHEEIAKKIGKSRSSVTELLSLRMIPDEVKAICIENGVISKSQLLQVARQPSEAKMREVIRRFAQGTLNRDQARQERNPEKKPRNAAFRFVPPTKDFRLTLQFRKGSVERDQVIAALRRVLEELENEA
ncbi:MAG: ParB/RepB/Spo0J family partition protein [Acidobacteria bacterium]|nr:ParB/RepB/Spo0J family partition protein [Acidobacteriota bacterium]